MLTKHRRSRNAGGFSLVEMLIATLILLPVMVAIMYTFLRSTALMDMSRNSSTALRLIKNRLTTIENTPFSQIKNTYHMTTFSDAAINGIGVTYIDDSQSNILDITAVFCWQEKDGRMIGEDQNLDGQLNGGEDSNSNGRLDSPVEIQLLIQDT